MLLQGPDYSQVSYIATQGPLTNTIYDFWLMVYQNYKRNIANSTDSTPVQQKIAMLTDIIENDESKCAIYFPQSVNRIVCFVNNDEGHHTDHHISQARLDGYFAKHDDDWFGLARPGQIHTTVIAEPSDNHFPAVQFNFFAVKAVACANKGGYSIRKMHCLYHTYEPPIGGDCPERTNASGCIQKVHAFVVYHYWFPHWPDHRSPENIDVVLDMCINLLDADCEVDFASAEHLAMDDDATRDGQAKETLELQSSLSGAAPPAGPTLIIHW